MFLYCLTFDTYTFDARLDISSHVSRLKMFSLIILIVVCFIANHVTSQDNFPIHDSKDDVMINPTFDPRDKLACGLFKSSSTTSGRVYNGEPSYVGQFPWTVCLICPIGRYVVRDYVAMEERGYTNPPDESIFDIGQYPFSQNDGDVVIREVKSWRAFCTGSIIDEHWIISAAHCTEQTWEDMYFFVNAGTTQCLDDGQSENLRMVVTSRLDPMQTIFEHPNSIYARGGDSNYDLVLIRIQDPYNLPVNSYNNEAINRICLYSYSDLPIRGCLSNVYFSGFGIKTDDDLDDPNEETSKLTWFKAIRMTEHFCKIHGISQYHEGGDVDCYSPVPWHLNLSDNSSKIDAAIRNRTEVESYPNTCPADSGGPFMYYMNYDGDGGNLPRPGFSPGYRALLTGVLRGGAWRKDGDYFCEKNWVSGRDKLFNLFYNPLSRVFYRALDLATTLNAMKIESAWFQDVLNYRHSGQLTPKGNVRIYPDVDPNQDDDYEMELDE